MVDPIKKAAQKERLENLSEKGHIQRMFNLVFFASFSGAAAALCLFWAMSYGHKLEQSGQKVPLWVFATIFGLLAVAAIAFLTSPEDLNPLARPRAASIGR